MSGVKSCKMLFLIPAWLCVVFAVVFQVSGCGNRENALKVTIIEQEIPQTALITQRFEAAPSGQLNAKDNINEVTADRIVQKGSSIWEITDIQFRPSAKDSWQKVPPPAHTQASTYPVPLGVSGDVPYRMIVGFADKTGEWQFTLRLTRTYFTPDKKEIWRGSGEYTLVRTLRVDSQKPKSYALLPGKAYIAGMQWCMDTNSACRDVPQQGEPGFPLTLSSGFIDLRAVPKNPREPWPDAAENQEQWPRWEGKGIEPGNPGDALLVFDDAGGAAQHAKDYKTVTVTCGNTVTRQILVVPRPDIFVYEPTVVPPAKGKTNKVKNVLFLQSQAEVKWEGGWHPPIKVRFRLHKLASKEASAKRSPIGQINGPSPADDVVTIPGDGGTAKVKLSVPANTGLIELRAELVTPGTTEGYFGHSRANTLTLSGKQPIRKANLQ